MLTPAGRTFVMDRLTEAPDIEALRRAWDNLSDGAKRDKEIEAHKDALKAQMETTHG
ncbi:MAG: hypothetical protein ABNH26_08545 [Celeribacter sp.]|jgi:hypothetical protein